MTTTGILIGAATFLTIGAFHPLVIKAEYQWGHRCWWLFLVAGGGCIAASLLVANLIASTLLGVVGFSSLWSIHELLKQRTRVDKGWFPAGPGHLPKTTTHGDRTVQKQPSKASGNAQNTTRQPPD